MKPVTKAVPRTNSVEWVAGDYTHRSKPGSWFFVIACWSLFLLSAGVAFWWADGKWGLQ